MNISHEDLKAAYISFLRSHASSPRRDCPDLSQIWRLFNNSAREKTKSQILRHIDNCSFCADTFLDLLELKRSVDNLDAYLRKLSSSQLHPSPDVKRASFFHLKAHRGWQFAALGFGSVFVATAILLFLNINPFSRRIDDQIRNRIPIIVQLLRPASGDALSKNELLFRWEKRGLITFVIEIFDEELARIWKSEPLNKSEYSPTSDVKFLFNRGKSYYWMITGYDQDGKTIESHLSGFRILD